MTETMTIRSETAESYISDEMRAAIGSTLATAVSFPISESDIRRWALAVYYPDTPPARFLYPEAAAKSRYGGIVAPEDFNPFAWLAAERETAGRADVHGNDPGHIEILLGVTPPPVKFQLNGGLAVEYGVPMRPGDVISSVSKLASYRERSGGRFGLMLFTVLEDTWTNQSGEFVKRTESTVIRY
ncbi:MAG TPA: MaoC family dehydratase N-terminal domain-containing protein [Amycolatopsis sp.]|nr:MaoC family dehydratase N-terminal domain-containing protein [Amycolatopsis sp.]